MKRFFYVYILKCVDESLYTGITNNLENRFREHNKGINKTAYTFRRRPVELIWYTVFQDPEEAIKTEKRIKKWSKQKKLALANDDWESVKKLSECLNNTSHKKLRR
mgnify:CR=1 FL=1